MATAIATKLAPPHQKMKRPPPPAVQTGFNSAKPSQSSPSPSLGSMRAPSASKHPPSATNTNGVNGIVNGTGSRSSTRRRDAKSGKPGQDGDRRVQKKVVEPYAKSTSYVLRKFRKSPPSVILHLHPTHFRFDQQDGTFSYNSPMRFVLEHIKNETVPHDIVEELIASNVKFYEGCLIVQIVDHRTAAATSNSKNQSGNDKDIPFSIHNRNESLTPSPYIPYLNSDHTNTETRDMDGDSVSSRSKLAGETPAKASASVQSVKSNEQVQKMTTVLFPTTESLQAEVAYYATTPDPRSVHRKQSTTSNVPRTPASATVPHTPTPLSAVPSTPQATGPANKKQKMLVGTNDIRNFESSIVSATAAPLFLDHVESRQEAQKLIEDMTDSRHRDGYPAPRTRKRTVAELAADEALAAQEQRFMLIMDERLAPSASAGAAGKANVADGEIGTAGFEPRFERFKLVEQIKAEQQAKKQREREQTEQRNAMQAVAKAKQDQENEARRREHHQLQEQRQANQEHARLEQQMKQSQQNQAAMLAMQQQEMRRRQQQQAAQQTQASQPPNGIMPNAPSHMVATSQAHQSPIARQMTPHSNSSPTVGHATHAGQGQPMNITSSAQGVTSSPARPPSALQHAHPAPGGVAMVHQRSAQGPSRRGTPQMSNGTPSMSHATPVMTSAAPIPRMPHGSPPSSMAQTPMAPNAVAAQHIGMGAMTAGLTPEQHRQVQIERTRQATLAQQQRQRQQLAAQQQMQQNGHPAQMSPERMQLQYQHQQQQQQLHLQAQQQAAYQDQIRKQQTQQMNGHIGSPHLGQTQLQPGQGGPQHGHPGQQQLHPGQPRQMPNQLQVQIQQIRSKAFSTKMAQFQQQCGGQIPPDKEQHAKQAAMQYANLSVQQHQNQMLARQAEVEQQQQRRMMMMQAQPGGMNGGMMGSGMNSMNGIGMGMQ